MSEIYGPRGSNWGWSRGGRSALAVGITVVVLGLLLIPLTTGSAEEPAYHGWRTLARGRGITVRGTTTSLSRRANMVVAAIAAVRPHIARDVGVRLGRLTVDLYSGHASFAVAMRKQQHTSAQSSEDNTSAIVHGRLLLGPTLSQYLRHDLVHVYTEWALDRRTGNRDDALPASPWLYDGIAEFEAYRYVSARLPCRATIPVPFTVTALRTPGDWLRMRGGPLAALEYCAAYLTVRDLIEREGWVHVMRMIRQDGWQKAGAILRRKVQVRSPLLNRK